MANLLLLSYNNYFNRLYRKENSAGNYVQNSAMYVALGDINFNPGDGVTTSLVVGKGQGAFLN